MKLKPLPFTYFPDDFRKETVDRIKQTINSGECLQLIGLPGSGKSSFLSNLLLQRLKDCQVFYFDLNLLPEKSTLAILRFLAASLSGQVQDLADPQLITQAINQFLKEQQEKSQKTVFIFDDFQNLTDPSLLPFFQTLRSFHFHHRPFLTFIFALEREVRDYSPFGSLGTHLSENILFLPPLTQKEALWFLQEYEKAVGIKLPDQEKKEIIAASGGFMRTLKRLAQAKPSGQSGQNLKEVLKNPWLNPHLKYHFEQLLAGLKSEETTLKNIVFNQISPADKENLAVLQNLYLIDKDNQPIHPLFFQFLKQKFSQEKVEESLDDKINLKQRLTANEYKLLKYLVEHKTEICSKENLITTVWGKGGLSQVANHSLDQLLYRLKKKLVSASPAFSLEIIRGRGIKLSIPEKPKGPWWQDRE